MRLDYQGALLGGPPNWCVMLGEWCRNVDHFEIMPKVISDQICAKLDEKSELDPPTYPAVQGQGGRRPNLKLGEFEPRAQYNEEPPTIYLSVIFVYRYISYNIPNFKI